MIRRVIRRLLIVVLEGAAALVAVALLGVGILLGRLALGPIESATLTPYLETALAQLAPDASASIGASLLIWDRQRGFLALTGERIVLKSPDGKTLANLPRFGVRMNLGDLARGRWTPRELILDRPEVWLTRRRDRTLQWGGVDSGRASVPQQAEASESSLEATTSSALAVGTWLRTAPFVHLVLKDGRGEVEDELLGDTLSLAIPTLALMRASGATTGTGRVEVTRHGTSAALNLRYVDNPKAGPPTVTLRFDDVSPAFLGGLGDPLRALEALDAPLRGAIQMELADNLMPKKVEGWLEGGPGHLTIPALWDAPTPFKSLTVKGVYEAAAGTLTLPEVVLDLGGPKLTGRLEVRGLDTRTAPSEPPPGGHGPPTFTLALTVDNLPANAFATFWPKAIVPDAYVWIRDNVAEGTFTRGEVTLTGRWSPQDLTDVVPETLAGTIMARNMKVSYLEGLPPVDGVQADATFDLGHMDVRISQGTCAGITLLPFTLALRGFEESTQTLDLPVRLTGSAKDVVSFLSRPRLGYAQEFGLKPNAVTGKVTGTLNLTLPLLQDLQMRDVGITADAQLDDVGVQDVVKGVDLGAGRLALALTGQGLTVKGTAELEGVPADLVWTSVFTPNADEARTTLDVRGMLDNAGWQRLGLRDVGLFQGTAAVAFTYREAALGAGTVEGTLDARRAAVTLFAPTWKKPMGASATVKVRATVPAKSSLVRVTSLTAQGSSGLSIKGSGTLDSTTGAIRTLDLSPFRLGATHLVAHIDHVSASRGGGKKGGVPLRRVRLAGPRLDLQGLKDRPSPTSGTSAASASKGVDSNKGEATIYAVTLGEVLMGPGHRLRTVRVDGERDATDLWRSLDATGEVGDGQKMALAIHPRPSDQGGGRSLTLKAEDFGGGLAALDLAENVRGGTLDVQGESTAERPGAFRGTLKARSFAVKGLPLLERLFHAISPFGFVDLVTGQSSFDRLQGAFTWDDDLLTFKDLRAVGSSFGINATGRVAVDKGEVDLAGTIVPFSFMNRMIGSVPFLGDLLTGGNGGGILALTYTIKGSLEDPNVSVNPASLLTPGFLRNLFFGEGASSESGEGSSDE